MKPRDVADSMSTASTTFTLPIAEARTKAREIINGAPTNELIRVVENWHLASDGQIQFTVRSLRLSR